MDSFTHALAAALLAVALGRFDLVPFAVAGSVIIDADVFAARLADGRPERYLVTHGGITHSIIGAAGMALPAFAVAALVGPAAGFAPATVIAGIAAALGGTYLHLALDWLACPGIPLFAPRSDRKYTLGLLPGPSLLLFGASIALLVALALGADPPASLAAYALVAAAFLVVRLAAFAAAHMEYPGAARLVPTVGPLRWLVLRESPGAWTVEEYRIGRGTTSAVTHAKFQGTSSSDAAPYLDTPQARRLRYHSYITTVAREGDALVIADPLRTSRAIRYPPYFAEARIPLQPSPQPQMGSSPNRSVQ